jgi:Nif-specific regulatory protein
MTTEQIEKRYRRRQGELSLLSDISRILDRSVDLREIIDPVLGLLSDNLGLHRGTVSLFNRQAGELRIENAYGLSVEEQGRGRYRIGEGIIGRVLESGKPIVVPRMIDEPAFLDKTRSRTLPEKEQSAFICVPIIIENEAIGTLSVDRTASDAQELDDDVRLLGIVASMIAQAVKLRRRIQEEKQRFSDEKAQLRERLQDRFNPANMIGNSRAMQEVYNLIAQVAKSDSTVLIRGESGTGKELVAEAVHYSSRRADKPFIKVNCAALPDTVIESELFGHEKGAFTSAVAMRKGRFELAHGGSIFLDEIGDLSPNVQVKLLRILQAKEFERVGGNVTIRTNVRIIAATHQPLEELLAAGKFREDLFYRLNVFPIHVPPLRERKSDIILLADHFAEKYGRQNGREIKRISTPAIDLLMMYYWPGNVRELENCIERATLLSTDGVIHGHHLPPSLQSAESTGTTISNTLRGALDRLEMELLQDALKSSRGNMAGAARLLGITERQMGLRVRKYRIDTRHFHT